jgi:MinD-like ATPase involved in chromosome partitioning or flagellar assembly
MSNLNGEIITFYSYKGGVGRSMALANIACLLARKQKDTEKILMIDWDLEAPGLHQFFHGKFTDNINEKADLSTKQLGLIDLFYEIKNQLEKNLSPNNSLENIFKKIEIEKYIVKINYPSLYLMPAGKFDDGFYSSRVNQFDWADFFDKYPLVIKQFAEYLRKKYKFVLIDSRTGYTDISGICTSIMPEKLVTVFTPNRQSVSGVVEMIRRATDYRKQSDDLRPLMIFPLPSRIETGESILQKEWRFGNSEHEGYQIQIATALKNVYDLENCDLTNYFDKYKLQYIPRYSYGEELAVLSERSEDRLSLAYSFENFSEKILGSESPWEEVRDSFIGEDEEENVIIDEFSKAKDKARRRTFIQAIISMVVIAGFITFIVFASSTLNYYLLILLFIVLGFSKQLRYSVLSNIINVASLLGDAGTIFRKEFFYSVFPRASANFIRYKDLQSDYSNMLLPINIFFESSVHSLRTHAHSVSERLEPDYTLRAWRFFGYLFQLILLYLFTYADIVQLSNNLAVILPLDITISPIFNNLSLSILITSVGTVVGASFIIADFAGITKFGKWNEIQSKPLRGYIQFLAWFALIMTLLIDVVIATARLTTSPEVAQLLTTETSNMLIFIANVAQILVILPLLIITFLFLNGIVGLVVLYIILVWIILFLIQITQTVFVGTLWLLVFGVTYLFQILGRVIFWIISLSILFFGWIFSALGITLVRILEFLKSVLEILYFPMDSLVNWLITYFEKRESGFNKG